MKGMHGIIFSYEKQTDLRELIANRIHGSIPFGSGLDAARLRVQREPRRRRPVPG